MYVAKKDFTHLSNKFKKGEPIKASDSLIEKWLKNGNIEEQHELTTAPKKTSKKRDQD